VIAIVIMLGGIGGILSLPVEQYPDIAPPSVNIRASYPGASARDGREQRHPGDRAAADRDRAACSISPNSNARAASAITATFDKGSIRTSPRSRSRTRCQQALPRLPQQVQQQGLVVTKSNQDFLMVVAVYDESDRMTSRTSPTISSRTCRTRSGRIPGVGDTNVFGAQYAMRIWLDPYKLPAIR
jgi:multidrug efflux pump